METVGQGVQKEAADELEDVERHQLALVVVPIIPPAEAHAAIGEADKPAVGDGNAVGVAAEIGEDLRRAAEGTLGIHDPVGPAQLVDALREGGWLRQSGKRAEEAEFAGIERGETVYDPRHYVPMLARKPGALRNGAPFKEWVLPTAMEQVRRKLKLADYGNRQMVDILTTVQTDRLPAVEAACAEALEQGVHSADMILNILARSRDPGRPDNILTPADLALRHAPVANCSRYDSLGRAV